MDSSESKPFPIEGSTLHHFWLMEQAEIDRVKWLESEKVGFDVGRERAHFIWYFHGRRAHWINEMKGSGIYPQS